MKSWALAVYLLTVLAGGVFSQTEQAPSSPPATQPSNPAPSQSSSSSSPSSSGQNRSIVNQQRQESRRIDSAFEALRMLEIQPNGEKPLTDVMSQEIQPLYRKPGKKELKDLQPSQLLLSQYEQFLKQPGTGIFKLNGDSNCAINSKVVVATESCLARDIPGAGTAYSFRVKSYRMLHLADLILDKNIIRTDGILQQGIMVNLGNIELDDLSAQSSGLKYLLNLKPALDKKEIMSLDESLSKGIKADGYTYAYGFFADDKTTFALRSIAYRGKILRSVSGYKYNEMDFDKRKDIVVLFRIVEKEANGDVTILWKEISRQDSPFIKVEEKNK